MSRQTIRYPMVRFLPALLIFATFGQGAKAQSGQFLHVWAGPQYVGIQNYDDYNDSNYNNQRSSVSTYRWGGGVDYINNFNQNYGFQTGLYYSGQGQKYTGIVSDFYHGDSAMLRYHSEVTMDYIRVPLMLRFNSVIDGDDRLNISIFLGLQAGYLISVHSYTNPDAPQSVLNNYPHFNFRQLYHALDFGLGAGAQFNVRITPRLYASLGIRFDKSLANIENKDYVLPDDAPVEWFYPISTKKEVRYSHLDVGSRNPSKHISVNVFPGLVFKIKDGKPARPHPVDELPE